MRRSSCDETSHEDFVEDPDEGDTKRCNECGAEKPLTGFYRDFRKNRRPNSTHAVCKECVKAHSALWRKNNPDLVHAQRLGKRGAHRHRTYGVTQARYKSMLEAQGNVCAICREPERRVAKNGLDYELGVDHDHSTGEVRGLLCTRCNSAIAFLREDPELFASACRYLRKSKRKSK